MSRRLWLVILLCVPVFLSADEKVRKPWYIGFGLGTFFDAAWVTDGVELTWEDFYQGTTPASPKVCANLKLGATVSPNLLLGFDLTAIRQVATGSDPPFWDMTLTTQISNLFAMATVFPFRRGPFVRLGGGFSSSLLEVDYLGTDRETYDGYGLLGGLGCAFWLDRRFNLTLNVDHSRQFYSDPAGPDTSRFTTVYVAFDWY